MIIVNNKIEYEQKFISPLKNISKIAMHFGTHSRIFFISRNIEIKRFINEFCMSFYTQKYKLFITKLIINIISPRL